MNKLFNSVFREFWLFCSIGRTKYGNWYLFHVPLDNEPLSMRYSVSEAAADESLLPCIQPITSTSHCKVAFAA